jgi:ketosteroid isomerase-like protein
MRPMSAETDVLKRFYAAVNRNDMQSMVKDFDSEIVRIEPEGFAAAGTYRGVSEVQNHVAKGRGSWAEGTCEPEEFLQNGYKVVAYLHVRVRLRDSTEWVDARFADGFAFRNGKIVQYLSFGDRADALKWAGINKAE